MEVDQKDNGCKQEPITYLIGSWCEVVAGFLHGVVFIGCGTEVLDYEQSLFFLGLSSKTPAVCTLLMVPCGSLPVARLYLAKNEAPEEEAVHHMSDFCRVTRPFLMVIKVGRFSMATALCRGGGVQICSCGRPRGPSFGRKDRFATRYIFCQLIPNLGLKF